MSTASTKRARKKERAQARERAGREESPAAGEAPAAWREELLVSERTYLYAALAVMLAAAFLRLVVLELKPMHHDEGVNGFFLTTLLKQGIYRYDPSNYHGPVLYYLTLPSVAVLGLNTFAVRLVTAAFGVATVGLMLYLRRYIGAVGALAAAALVAFSPGAVYYSRYFIHETLFVFFTVALVVAALRYWETREALYMLLASASAALMFATKETAFISAGVLLLATGVAWGYARFARGSSWDPPGRARDARRGGGRREYGGSTYGARGSGGGTGGGPRLGLWLAAAAVFVLINVIFYSSFFTNAKGVTDALGTFEIWKKTGHSDFHRKEFIEYGKWLLKEEVPTLALATFGAAAALIGRRRNRFAVFAGAWAFGTALAYSLIPYKTPWLMLSFTVPMAIAGGYAVQLVADWARRSAGARSLAALCVGFALAVCIYQTAVLNFFEYDDDRHPYVYAHTRREAEVMMREVERLSQSAGAARTAGIAIATPDYWPLPWYLREHTSGVAYDQKVQTRYDPKVTQIVIGKDNQVEQLRAVLGADYRQVGGEYPLRPGVNLVLFARADLAGR